MITVKRLESQETLQSPNVLRLAEAYERMTLAEIKAHGLALANAVEQLDGLLTITHDSQVNTVTTFNAIASLLVRTCILTEALSAHLNEGRLMAAKGLANNLASVARTFAAVKPLDFPVRWKSIIDAWPTVFEPKEN